MSDRPHIKLADSEKDAFNTISETVRTAVIVLLTFSIFCWIIVGAPDTFALRQDAFINLPFAGTPVSFPGFLIIAPLILIGIFTYIHVLLYELRKIAGSADEVFFHLNLRSKPAKLMATAVLYWLVPITLAAITYKSMTRLEWALPMMFVTIGVVFATESVRRMMNDIHLARHTLRRTVTLALLLCMVLGSAVYWCPDYILRTLRVQGANLQSAWLIRSNLRRVDLTMADLTNANLRRACLSNSTLTAADLRRAVLRDADLRNANLVEASLGAADAVGADFRGADLKRARLRGADLQRAKLFGADLTDADLSGANVEGSDLENAILCRTILKDGQESQDACRDRVDVPTPSRTDPCPIRGAEGADASSAFQAAQQASRTSSQLGHGR